MCATSDPTPYPTSGYSSAPRTMKSSGGKSAPQSACDRYAASVGTAAPTMRTPPSVGCPPPRPKTRVMPAITGSSANRSASPRGVLHSSAVGFHLVAYSPVCAEIATRGSTGAMRSSKS